MTFPENCLRGIPNNDLVTQDGVPSSNLFYPMNNLEVSINWEDDQNALLFTLSQKRDDNEFQFKYGVAILPLVKIDEIINECFLQEPISINREPLEDNPYHGNIVYKESLTKEAKRMIAGMLALNISSVIKRDISSDIE